MKHVDSDLAMIKTYEKILINHLGRMDIHYFPAI